MMKKACGFLVTLFFSFVLFADAKNIVYNNSFDFKNIDSLEISLKQENLKITRIYGEEIVVEIGSNNIKHVPQVLLEQDEFSSVLKITSPQKRAKTGTNCTVYIYLPQDFVPETIDISLVSGNLLSEALYSENAISLKNVSGRIDTASCKTDYCTASAVSGNLTLQKVNAGYLDITNNSGNTFIELEKAVEAKSRVTSVSGKIQVYYKKNESPDLDDSPDFIISSVSGKVETVPFD